MVGTDLEVAVGHEAHHCVAPELHGQELDELERRDVGPLRVVDDDDERSSPGGDREELSNGIEETKSGVGRLLRRRRCGGSVRLSDQAADFVQPLLSERGRQVGGQSRHDFAQCLHPWPQGRCPLAVPTGGPHDASALAFDAAGDLAGQRRLADAGFARHHDELAAAGEQPVDGRLDGLELLVTSDDRDVGHRPSRRARCARLIPNDFVQKHRRGDAFELRWPELPEGDLGSGQQHVLHHVGGHDLAALRHAGEPGHHVHCGAEYVAVVLGDFTDMDGNPHSDRVVDHRALDRDRARDRPSSARERGEKPVPHRFDDRAAVLFDA